MADHEDPKVIKLHVNKTTRVKPEHLVADSQAVDRGIPKVAAYIGGIAFALAVAFSIFSWIGQLIFPPTEVVSTSTASCPGGAPKLRTIGASWEDARPGAPYSAEETPCDLVFGIAGGSGQLELDNSYKPKVGDIGLTSSAPRKLRALNGEVTISYLLCPPGTGTKDGRPHC